MGIYRDAHAAEVAAEEPRIAVFFVLLLVCAEYSYHRYDSIVLCYVTSVLTITSTNTQPTYAYACAYNMFFYIYEQICTYRNSI